MSGLPRSTVFRNLRALAQSGFLIHSESHRRYVLGPRSLRLGLAARSQFAVGELAAGPMQELATHTRETVILNVLDLPQRTIAYVVEAPSELRFEANVGDRLPLTAGAAGKVILASLPLETARAVISGSDLSQDRRAALEEQLARIRKAGFVITAGERVAGAVALAAPVWAGEFLFGSLTVVGPASRAEKTIGDHRDAVCAAAEQVSLKLSVDSVIADTAAKTA